MALNLEKARFNMVEQQVRTWDVLDHRVLDVLRTVPREDFVPSRYRRLAFTDVRIPLAQGQVMMKPVEEGRMLQGLDIQAGQRVLEIGTGSGFISACLSALGAEVVSLEIFPELAERAATKLERAGVKNVEVRQADGLHCGDFSDRFDAVVVTASVAVMPPRLMELVKTGGLIFAVCGQTPAMEAVCMRQTAPRRWDTQSLFETDLPRLIGAEDPPTFEF